MLSWADAALGLDLSIEMLVIGIGEIAAPAVAGVEERPMDRVPATDHSPSSAAAVSELLARRGEHPTPVEVGILYRVDVDCPAVSVLAKVARRPHAPRPKARVSG